jgi:P-type E1-E2 ATPase
MLPKLVVGDLLEVKLGDKLPADIRVLSNQKLKVDNSALTGESGPVSRIVGCPDDNPLETKNLAFFGTLAVDGTALRVVVNTGEGTLLAELLQFLHVLIRSSPRCKLTFITLSSSSLAFR